jgi:hypothetical protein
MMYLIYFGLGILVGALVLVITYGIFGKLK